MVGDRLPRSSLTKVLHLVDFLPALCVGGSIRRMRRKRTHRELPLWGSCHGSAVTERVDDLLAENRTPPIALRGPFGAASARQKSLAEFRARKREIRSHHFLRGHVRRRKYFSARKCANRPPQADGAFAQRAASTLSENPAGVFRQSRAAPLGPRFPSPPTLKTKGDYAILYFESLHHDDHRRD